MASPLVTFLENYHWKGYTVDTIANHANTMMCLHRGNFPMHRCCKDTAIRCVPFNLLEGVGMGPHGEVEYLMGRR